MPANPIMLDPRFDTIDMNMNNLMPSGFSNNNFMAMRSQRRHKHGAVPKKNNKNDQEKIVPDNQERWVNDPLPEKATPTKQTKNNTNNKNSWKKNNEHSKKRLKEEEQEDQKQAASVVAKGQEKVKGKKGGQLQVHEVDFKFL